MSFVPFDEFDQDCKFPHKSSRVVLANLHYVLPQATSLLLGGIRLGENLIYDSESGLVNVPIPVLDAGDVGADPSGTSATMMATHLAGLDPHGQYSLETDVTNALALKVNNSAIGAPSGVAPLDENSNVPEQYLSFVQTGTGAVARTMQEKMRDVVSVMDFIPVAEHAAILAGTSTYDCSADIQDAITASNTVYFPNGTYLFSGITINTHNVTLYGAGESRSVLRMSCAAAAVAITIASTAFTSGVNIRNLKIEGSANNLGGISLGTTTFAAARIRIQDVFITGFLSAANGYGIRLNSNQNTDIENLWIQECRLGIYRANGGYSTSTRFSGKGSYFGRNCLHGIYVDGQCDDLYIQDGVVEGCLGVGIAVTANATKIDGVGRGTRLILDSVYFEENNKDGLSSYNAVQVIGTATGYAQHTLTMNECQFAANPSAPVGTKDVGIDRTYAYFNGCRLMPSNVVPTANCNVRFVSCKFPNAENYLTTLNAMPGNVSAFEFADAFASSNPNQMNFVNALTFPATARPVSDPNTLDDYEEGTWTPELSSDGTPPTIAYTEQLGTYTKIGNLVFLYAKIRGVLSVAGTGTPRITGLPAFPLVSGYGLDPVAVSYNQLLTGAPTSAHTLAGPLIELAGTAYQTGAGNNFLVVSVTYRTTA